MPSTIGKCKLFRIQHITLLEGETFLRNKHEIAFFETECTFFGRKENTISYSQNTPPKVEKRGQKLPQKDRLLQYRGGHVFHVT